MIDCAKPSHGFEQLRTVYGSSPRLSLHPIRSPRFQYDVIVGMMHLIAQGEKAWLDLYEKLDVKPLEVAYEDFTTSDGYEQTIRRVLRHLDLDDTIEIPRPRTDRQSDCTNDEWVDRSSMNGGCAALRRSRDGIPSRRRFGDRPLLGG